MFDIGFWELVIIGVLALVVVGPERLPRLAFTAGKWLGKGRSMLSAVKSEIDQELKAEEVRQMVEAQKRSLDPLGEVIEETTSTVRQLESELQQGSPLSSPTAESEGSNGTRKESQANPKAADRHDT